MSTTRFQAMRRTSKPQLVAVVNMIVDHRREQIVGEPDRAEVAGEMQVDVLHRHDLGIAAAGGAALHAEHRSERGFAQTYRGLLADPVQRVAKADRRRRLAFASRGRADRRDEDQLAVRPVREAIDIVQRYLGLVVAIRLQMLVRLCRACPCATSLIRCMWACCAISISEGMVPPVEAVLRLRPRFAACPRRMHRHCR